MNLKIDWDVFGISTSIACAIHCAVLPLILTSLPFFGINIIENSGFEFFMIALAFCVGSYSLYHGWKKHHGKLIPLILFFIGMGCLLAKQKFHQYHLVLVFPAIILIVIAHYYNYRLSRKNRMH